MKQTHLTLFQIPFNLLLIKLQHVSSPQEHRVRLGNVFSITQSQINITEPWSKNWLALERTNITWQKDATGSNAICFILFPSISVVAFPSTALLALQLAEFRINASSLPSPQINSCPQNIDPIGSYAYARFAVTWLTTYNQWIGSLQRRTRTKMNT